MTSKRHRQEVDPVGPIRVPKDSLYGAHTWRAVSNFPVKLPGHSLGDYPVIIRALVMVKLAAARANRDAGYLSTAEYELISLACQTIVDWPEYQTAFPVHILQGGGGTSVNMNINEVIALTATRLSRDSKTSDIAIDPIAHVNRNQSTNDVYPSACRLAIFMTSRSLGNSLRRLERAYARLRRQHGHKPRLARTCLQDAVGTTFEQLFGSYEVAVERCVAHLANAAGEIGTLNLGGGISGQPDATPVSYQKTLLRHIRSVSKIRSLTLSANYADAAQNADDLLRFAHELDVLARILIKQSNDLRFLSSGPDGGIGEIVLPTVQAGSSAMPGKVNPVIPEFVIQCGIEAIAASTACGLATDNAELDLNVWEGVYVYNLINSVVLLESAVSVFVSRCLAGLQVVEETNRAHAESLAAQVAAMAQNSSYQEALAHHRAIRSSS